MKLQSCALLLPTMALMAGLGGLFTVVNLACAQPWATTDAPNLSWSALAASADGARLVAAASQDNGYFPAPPAPVYVSTNAGATWTQSNGPSNNWSSVACSADGMKLVAVSTPFFHSEPGFGDGLIHTSPDGGTTWSPTSAPSNNWTSVASSADGTRLVAATAPVWEWDLGKDVGEGAIYHSPDAGATWTRTSAPSNTWTSVASSADGTKLVALAGLRRGTNSVYISEGAIYRSSDSGATWIRTSTLNTNWSAVASSADGAKLVAAAGQIYTSSDSGATWTATTAPSHHWRSVASSADGTRLVAVASEGNGSIYVSGDSGASWTSTATFPGVSRAAVAISADGYRVFAASSSGRICTLPYSGPWRLADAPRDSFTSWTSVASSADGSKLVAVPGRGNTLCTSTNSGTTWATTTMPNDRWSSVASSADGTKLVAVSWIEDSSPIRGDGLIYISGNSGATWTPTSAPSNRFWSGVASSEDGCKLVAVASFSPSYSGGGLIYTSGDSGVTWIRTSAPSNRWCSVASSMDGANLVAVADDDWEGDGLIYTSRDSGVTWTATSAPTNYWQAVASSADGTKLVAAAMRDAFGGSLGEIYTSGDSGATWTQTSAPKEYWWCVASSADGTKLVAGAGLPNPRIYASTDSGLTWTRAEAPAASWWYGIASSADGDHVVAVSGDGYVFTRHSPAPTPPLPPSPRLAIDRSVANVGLSWLVPSTCFVLQQGSDLGSADWVDVPTPPTLDLTNLHQRVTLTPSPGSSFYRLKQQ